MGNMGQLFDSKKFLSHLLSSFGCSLVPRMGLPRTCIATHYITSSTDYRADSGDIAGEPLPLEKNRVTSCVQGLFQDYG